MNELEKLIKIYQRKVNEIYKAGFDEYKIFLKFCAQGNKYNLTAYNKILAYAQASDSSYLNTYENWKKLGRYSKRSAKISLYKNGGNGGKNYFNVYDYGNTKTYNEDENSEDFMWDYTDEVKDYVVSKLGQENFEKSIKNLTRTYVCDTILGRKIDLLKNDDMAEFVFECSMFVIMNRCNDSYILPEKIEKIYYSIDVKDYAQFLADVGIAISLLSNNVIFRLRNYFEEYKKERNNIYDRKSDKVRSTVGQVGEETNNGRGKERTDNVSGQHDGGRISGGNAVRRGSSGISDGSGDNKRGRSVRKDTDGVHIRERHRDVHDAYGIEQNERLRASEGRGISDGNVQTGGFVHERTQDGEYAISEVSEPLLSGEQLRTGESNANIITDTSEHSGYLETSDDDKVADKSPVLIDNEELVGEIVSEDIVVDTFNRIPGFIREIYNTKADNSVNKVELMQRYFSRFICNGENFKAYGASNGISFFVNDIEVFYDWEKLVEKIIKLFNDNKIKKEYLNYSDETIDDNAELYKDIFGYVLTGVKQNRDLLIYVMNNANESEKEQFVSEFFIKLHSLFAAIHIGLKNGYTSFNDTLNMGENIIEVIYPTVVKQMKGIDSKIALSDKNFPLVSKKISIHEAIEILSQMIEEKHLVQNVEFENIDIENCERSLYQSAAILYNKYGNAHEYVDKDIKYHFNNLDVKDVKVVFGVIESNDYSENIIMFDNDTPELDYSSEMVLENDSNENTSFSENGIEESAENKISSDKENVVANDYKYPEDWQPNAGGDKSRFKYNIDAIKILKSVEAAQRNATFEEQNAMSLYVGWGGLANAFDSRKEQWKNEYDQLKTLLGEDEYNQARTTVNDAFYTSPSIIKAIYKAVIRMGFRGGNILEPSMGIGNFYSAIPEEIEKNSNLYGVEIDDISGRIAKLLHPSANIQICGFQDAQFDDNFFDLVIGNVPFGNFKINDPKYKKESFYIHDYFVVKALDKVAPGGIVALITSKGTLDKANSKFRRTIAEKAEMLGAIRLPNTAFKDSANTTVTSDILFFKKKRKAGIDIEEPNWLDLGKDYLTGISYNQYYFENPIMMLGEIVKDKSMFGENSNYTGLRPFKVEDVNIDFDEMMDNAIANLPKDIFYKERDNYNDNFGLKEKNSIPATSDIKNYTLTVVDGEVYRRENSILVYQQIPDVDKIRVAEMCRLRDSTKAIIALQMDNCSDKILEEKQSELSVQYDTFVGKYGYLREKKNRTLFSNDVENTILSALEDEKEHKYVKADIFSKRTIRPYIKPTSAATAKDALTYSLNDYGKVNIEYMIGLYKVEFETLIEELKGKIFLNPEKMDEKNPYNGWENADEYLSGNVVKKLEVAREYAKLDKKFNINVSSLEAVQPERVEAQDIYVRLGTTWIRNEDYKKFIFELLELPDRYAEIIDLNYDEISNTYFFTNKGVISYNDKNTKVYGTKRVPAILLIESLLNQRDIEVKDRVDTPDGKVRYVKNQRESLIAIEKGKLLNERFKTWIFDDLERRNYYTDYYNKTFNNMVLREFDGSDMTFPGMNPDIELLPHQANAVARIVQGGNTLLGHCVGAGKSFEIAAAAMELKRLGLANKPLIVVPTPLPEQMAQEFLKLYPSADILLATKKDLQKENRRHFISKIATGEYDAVIMGQSQFEKIPMSRERQRQYLKDELDEIMQCIDELQRTKSDNWTVKKMESERKRVEGQLEKLKRDEYKDDNITFEELGVDALFMDEAHYYKNLSFATKMTRVAGINPSGAKKCMDLFLKIRYINEKTPGRNVIFATGTPVSNTMCEMYTMMKYLEPEKLREAGVYHFDAWAGAFGETVTAMELAPEGNGYRQKTSFSKFVNVPELMSMFKNVADIVTSDMIDLKLPKLVDDKYIIVESEPNEEVKKYMRSFVERADMIHNGKVDPTEDNMLKVCNDGRLLAADIRLIDPNAENDPNSKLNKVIENVYNIYQKTMSTKSVQAICSDIGTPSDGFNIYDYIKSGLIAKGIPEEQICFIHDATTEIKRKNMMDDLRKGDRRIILGSTTKLGTGTNIQNKLIAMHEIDVPWRPSDVEQREGRILRQGNENEKVYIFRYVTKGTFDAYNWSLIEKKQSFIGQIMKSNKVVSRSCDDIDEVQMSYAEVKAIASGNPLIKEKSDIENELRKLDALRSNYQVNRYDMEGKIKIIYPNKIEKIKKSMDEIKNDIQRREKYNTGNEEFTMLIKGKTVDKIEDAANLFTTLAKNLPLGSNEQIAEYAGFKISVQKGVMYTDVAKICVEGNHKYYFDLSDKPIGNITKIRNTLKKMENVLGDFDNKLKIVENNLNTAIEEYGKPFEQQERFDKLLARKTELEMILSKDNMIKDDDDNRDIMQHTRKGR